MLYKNQLLRSFALFLLLKLCLPVSGQDNYNYYDGGMDNDEAMSVYYGNHKEEQPVLPASTEASPPKDESRSSSEESPDSSQPRQKDQEHVVADHGPVLSDQNPEETSAVGPDVDLRQLASQNKNAVRKIASIMAEVVSKLSNQGCVGTGGSGVNNNMQRLSDSIKEGFTVLVGAVQDLNTTLQNYQAEITRKVFGIQQAATTFESDGPCPAPFHLAGSDCLYIETEHLRDFQTARQACIEMGAKLAEFKTFQPFIDAVHAMQLRYNAEILIGGTDSASENHWVWLSGVGMPSILWGQGEPNNIGEGEHCIALTARTGKFNDLACSLRREYVCQWMPYT